MEYKYLIPSFSLLDGKVVGYTESAVELAVKYSNAGADKLIIYDLSNGDAEHDKNLGVLKEICRKVDLPVIAGGNVKRFEDVKKLIYAGCSKAIVTKRYTEYEQAILDAAERFGKEKIIFAVQDDNEFKTLSDNALGNISEVIVKSGFINKTELPQTISVNDKSDIMNELKKAGITGITGKAVEMLMPDIYEFKIYLKENGINSVILESSVKWNEFKLDSNGLIPVVVQDYKTDEVLMLAYMNEEAFNTTLKIGMMTYYSRSRNELWTKGLTSGHLQYVKSLSIDCDKDTILAKVAQVGAACHTGNRSCFYTEMVNKSSTNHNPLKVFENVYNVIEDRKINPKEGSYTNYLFDKGIDKILKKVGEEATEIVIAAKNPDAEEIKYEISDFLYHVMVLMVERGVSWEDITEELSKR